MKTFLTAFDWSHHLLFFFKLIQCIRVSTNQSENIKKEKKKENKFYIVGVLVIFSFYRAEFYLRLQYFSCRIKPAANFELETLTQRLHFSDFPFFFCYR